MSASCTRVHRVLWCFNFSLFCSAAAMPWSCGWCGRWRRSSGGRGGGADREANGGGGGGGGAASGREEEQWSLFIELPVLEAATRGFSDDNLLGRGGFGPVYKACFLLPSHRPLSPWLCFAARLLPCFACGIHLTLTKTGFLLVGQQNHSLLSILILSFSHTKTTQMIDLTLSMYG